MQIIDEKHGKLILFHEHLIILYKAKSLKDVRKWVKYFLPLQVSIKGVINLTQREFHTFQFITF